MSHLKSIPAFILVLLIGASVYAASKDQSAINSSHPHGEWGDPGSDADSRARPVIGTGGMVVSDDRIAREWGAEILRRGGNAVDAASPLRSCFR